ncbi:MAG: MATE family efflux transporter [Treponemataceae bacterium]|nr:MATE family efflux transporter [Treponemataceae bacterium]
MSETKAIINDMTQGNLFKKMITFALPVMFANALQLCYMMIDMVIVGTFVGSAGLSAITIGSQVFNLMTTLAMGFSVGGQVYISQLIGAKEYSRLNHTIGTIFSLVGIMGLLMSLVGFLFSEPILNLMNTPAESFAMAKSYMMVCSGGVLFTYGYNMVSAILRGMGDSKRPLTFILISTAVNLTGDLLLVGYFKLGAAGAAWATILGQAVSFIIALIFLIRHKEAFHFDFKRNSFIPENTTAVQLMKLSIPFALQNSSIDISMMFVSALVNTFGVVASATFGVGSRLQSLSFVMSGAIGSFVSSMVGQNIAAKKLDRVNKGIHLGLTCTIGFWAILLTLFLTFPEACFRLFVNDPEVLAMAPMFMSCIAVGAPALAFMSPYNGFIQGIGNSKMSLFFSLLDGFVARITLSYLIGIVAGLGLKGFFLGYFIAPYFTTVPAMIYYYSGIWKKRTLLA